MSLASLIERRLSEPVTPVTPAKHAGVTDKTQEKQTSNPGNPGNPENNRQAIVSGFKLNDLAPDWQPAFNAHLNHIMACNRCYAPKARYCPEGLTLRDEYSRLFALAEQAGSDTHHQE